VDYIKRGRFQLLDLNFLRKPDITCWNIIHELAHNMQRSIWTPEGAEEIIVNIFTLHALDNVINENFWISRLIKQELEEKLIECHAAKNFPFNEWCNISKIGILLYAQLVNSFGWKAFKIAFREYESLDDREKGIINRLNKWDLFVTKFSNIVGLDISPLFYFWSIPFSDRLGSNLNELTPWLPDDEITQKFKERTTYVRNKYLNLLYGNEINFSICPKLT
jgi:hypothetical protein